MNLRERISKREASGALTLIIVIVFIQILIFLFNKDEREPLPPSGEELAISKQEPESSLSLGKGVEKNKPSLRVAKTPVTKQLSHNERAPSVKEYMPKLFSFDPNIATLEEFIELGLTKGQASVILKFRERGGLFRNREDLKKIYVLPDGFYERVKDYIEIEDYIETEESPPVRMGRERAIIDLNSADSLQLLSLPGIGPYYAGKIVDFRRKTGGFAYPSQIMDIKGIERDKFDMLESYIYADTSKIQKKSLEMLTYEELSANPYIGSYLARAIVRFRESIHPDIPNLAALLLNNIIKPELLRILNYYFH